MDHLMDEPIRAFIEPERVLSQLDRAFDQRVTERVIEEHLRPFIEREKIRSQKRQDTLGDWVSSEMQAELRTLSMRPVYLDRDFLRSAVQDASVKHMVKSIVQETLDRFITTLKPGGSGGGLVGSVGRSALGFASRAGKGILGQIGGQFEQQLQGAVASFAANSTSLMLDRLVVILTSPETAQHFGRSGATIYDSTMRQKTHRVWTFIEREIPLDDLLDAVPGQCLHILNRADVRDGILDEVSAILNGLGDQPLRTLFADDAQVNAWTEDIVHHATPIVNRFAKSRAFKAWLKG